MDLESLSDVELLALIVGAGPAKRLMKEAGELGALSKWGVTELVARGKLSESAAKKVAAALAAGRRAVSNPPQKGSPVDSPVAAFRVLRPMLAHLEREKFVVLLLDSRRNLIGARVISTGTLNATIVHPRDVFRVAAMEHAHSIVLAHNHPSGSTEPSPEDIALTLRLIDAGKAMGIAVDDHVIVAGSDDFTSIRETRSDVWAG